MELANQRRPISLRLALRFSLLATLHFGLLLAHTARAEALQAGFKLPPGMLSEIGAPESGISSHLKTQREIDALKKQIQMVDQYLPYTLTDAQKLEREKIIKVYNQRRTGVSFFLISQIMAEMVERGAVESQSRVSQWVSRLTGGEKPQQIFEKRKQCVATALTHWSNLSTSGRYDSTQEVIGNLIAEKGPFQKDPDCRIFLSSIIGPDARDTVHGAFIQKIKESESVLSIEQQKLLHMDSLRILVNISADQFPKAALSIAEFYFEDANEKVKTLAKSFIASIDTQYKIRSLLNWVRPDVLQTYVVGGLGMSAGFGYLSSVTGASALTVIKAKALAASLGLHLAAGHKAVSPKDKALTEQAFAIRNKKGQNKPAETEADVDNLDEISIASETLNYDLLSTSLLKEYAQRSRRRFFATEEIAADLGHFILAAELTEGSSAVLLEAQSLHALIDAAAAAVRADLQTTPSGKFAEKLNKARRSVATLAKLKAYRKYIAFITPTLKGAGGSCVSSTALFTAAFIPNRDLLPTDWKLGVQSTKNHIQAVLLDQKKGLAFDLDSGTATTRIQTGIYSPATYFEGFLRRQDQSTPKIDTVLWARYVDRLPYDSLLDLDPRLLAQNLLKLEMPRKPNFTNRFFLYPPILSSMQMGTSTTEEEFQNLPREANRMFADMKVIDETEMDSEGQEGRQNSGSKKFADRLKEMFGDKSNNGDSSNPIKELSQEQIGELVDGLKKLKAAGRFQIQGTAEAVTDLSGNRKGTRYRLSKELIEELNKAGISLQELNEFGRCIANCYGIGNALIGSKYNEYKISFSELGFDISQEDRISGTGSLELPIERKLYSPRDWPKEHKYGNWNPADEPLFKFGSYATNSRGDGSPFISKYELFFNSDKLRDEFERQSSDEDRAKVLLRSFLEHLKLKKKNILELNAFLSGRQNNLSYLDPKNNSGYYTWGKSAEFPLSPTSFSYFNAVRFLRYGSTEYSNIQFGKEPEKHAVDAFRKYEADAFAIPEFREVLRLEAELSQNIGRSPEAFLLRANSDEIPSGYQNYLFEIFRRPYTESVFPRHYSSQASPSNQHRELAAKDWWRTSVLAKWLLINGQLPIKVTEALSDPTRIGITEKLEKNRSLTKLPLIPEPKGKLPAIEPDRLQLVDLTQVQKPQQCTSVDPSGKCREQDIVYLNPADALVYLTPRFFIQAAGAIVTSVDVTQTHRDDTLSVLTANAATKLAARLVRPDQQVLYIDTLRSDFSRMISVWTHASNLNAFESAASSTGGYFDVSFYSVINWMRFQSLALKGKTPVKIEYPEVTQHYQATSSEKIEMKSETLPRTEVMLGVWACYEPNRRAVANGQEIGYEAARRSQQAFEKMKTQELLSAKHTLSCLDRLSPNPRPTGQVETVQRSFYKKIQELKKFEVSPKELRLLDDLKLPPNGELESISSSAVLRELQMTTKRNPYLEYFQYKKAPSKSPLTTKDLERLVPRGADTFDK